MKIESIRIYRFSLPMVKPFRAGGTLLTSRVGFLLVIDSESGAEGLGEVSPLPGFHEQTADAACVELLRFRHWGLGKILPESLEELSGGFDRWLSPLALSPLARYAIESAALNLIASGDGKSLVSLLGETDALHVPVNALVTSDSKELETSLDDVLAVGYNTLKLKIDATDVRRDSARVRLVREKAPHVAIRLDANRSLDYEAASEFAGLIADCRIEYIEEPLREQDRLAKFALSHPYLPVALDESLIRRVPEELAGWPGLGAIVLKPSVHGVERTMRFIRRAINLGITPVVSSPFETGIGLAMSAALAAHAGTPTPAAGLDPYTWLESDILVPRIPFIRGNLLLTDTTLTPERIDYTRLTEVLM